MDRRMAREAFRKTLLQFRLQRPVFC